MPRRPAKAETVFLTVTTTHRPATDLGYLLHKHPGRVQAFDVSVGTAHVFYPEATQARCTAALLLEVDPVGLVRKRRSGAGRDGFALAEYVNDRPYAAASLLAVGLARVFRTAMAGRCEARPELAATPIPLRLHVPALPCRGGAELASRLFGPLGWTVEAHPVPLDEAFPHWGDSPYVDLWLTGTHRLAGALNHLYVLLPVLDDAKHYWVSTDEVDKLVRAGGGWLAAHPERTLITRRYLKDRTELVDTAVARLAEVDDTEPEALDRAAGEAETGDATRVCDTTAAGDSTTVCDTAVVCDTAAGDATTVCTTTVRTTTTTTCAAAGAAVPLAEQRRRAVLAALRAAGARRVADLGCGGGALLAALLADPGYTEVVGTDVSARALERAARALRLDRLPDAQRARLRLFQSSLMYRDSRLAGLDAAVLMEVVEHVDPTRLPALERTVFAEAAPATVVVTTPNAEYNVRFPGLPAGGMRHPDHRFEWTRREFRDWAERVAAEHRYRARLLPVGPDDPQVGPPTQLAVFSR